MIDWFNLILNACWIFGCAIALAALSYASWKASTQGNKFRVCVGTPHIQTALKFGGFLFCVGLTGTSEVLWQRILWIVLSIGFLFQFGRELHQKQI